MKLALRDKKLLTGLGILIFTAAFLKFIFLPKINDINALRTDIKTLGNTYAVNMTYKKKTESLDSDIKILSQRLNSLREIYPPGINCDELLIILNNIIGSSGLKVKAMGFEKAKPLDLQEQEATAPSSNKDSESTAVTGNSNILGYLYLWGMAGGQGADNQEKTVIPDGKGYSVTVKIDGQGTNEQIESFFKSLGELKNTVYCKTSSIARQSQEELKFTGEIEFYGIMDKGAGEYYLLENGTWSPEPPSGKTDVFMPYSGFAETEAGSIDAASNHALPAGGKENKDSKPEEDYDFSVTASAYGGGLAPSISILCKNPGQDSSYPNPVVYGDSMRVENGEIYIEQRSGKYYCKFKTDHEAYPDNQYTQTFEFKPSGKDLKLIVFSFPRKDDKDKSGISLNIINNSDKTFVYDIKNDDLSLPRVKIGKTSGKVKNAKD